MNLEKKLVDFQFFQLVKLYLSFFRDCVVLFFYSVLWAYPIALVRTIFPFRWKSLKNEIILVTGSASGIGREICLRLGKLEKCCTIICWDISEKLNNTLIEELRSLGVKKVAGFKVDVSDYDQVRAAAEKIKKDFGDVTILVNNAGIGSSPLPLWQMSSEEIKKVINVNLSSNMWTMKEFLPGMIRGDNGHVVTVCSISGYIPTHRGSVYVATKHGVRGCVESVKEDVRALPEKANVHFTTAYPHNVETPMLQSIEFTTKYPFLMPKIEAAHVAERIIHGMRTYEESIYLPLTTRWGVLLNNLLLPSVFRKWLDLIEYDVVSLSEENSSRFPS